MSAVLDGSPGLVQSFLLSTLAAQVLLPAWAGAQFRDQGVPAGVYSPSSSPFTTSYLAAVVPPDRRRAAVVGPATTTAERVCPAQGK